MKYYYVATGGTSMEIGRIVEVIEKTDRYYTIINWLNNDTSPLFKFLHDTFEDYFKPMPFMPGDVIRTEDGLVEIRAVVEGYKRPPLIELMNGGNFRLGAAENYTLIQELK